MPADALPDLEQWIKHHRKWRFRPILFWQCLGYELKAQGLTADDERVQALLAKYECPREAPPLPDIGNPHMDHLAGV